MFLLESKRGTKLLSSREGGQVGGISFPWGRVKSSYDPPTHIREDNLLSSVY